MTRHEQRVFVFKLIFESLFRKDETPEDIYLSECDENGYAAYPYISETFIASVKNTDESDALVREYAVGWSPERLSNTAKATMRLSLYELLHSDVPPKVVINEAVEIAKEYASEDEASFVNGILNKIAHDKNLI